jgi:hypothetical protein
MAALLLKCSEMVIVDVYQKNLIWDEIRLTKVKGIE